MESKHRKYRESDILYHYTSHISLTNVQELAYAPLYNKSSICGKGMTTLFEGMLLNTVQLFSLLHLEHMSMRPYATRHWICNHSRWFDSWGWFPSFNCHNKHWHMHSETPGKWQLLSPHVLVAFIKTISMPYALWKHACIYLTPLEAWV
jgi:hypothetical protein